MDRRRLGWRMTCGAAAGAARRSTVEPIYVALDLETTGLDVNTDKIIEVGAVKFRGETVLETYQRFVNPRIPLPMKVARLTGIAPEGVPFRPHVTLGRVREGHRCRLAEVEAAAGDYEQLPFLARSPPGTRPRPGSAPPNRPASR